MFRFLSYAEPPDESGANLMIVVVALAIIGAVGLMAAVAATLARRRAHRHREGIVAVLVLWAILSAASGIYSINAQMKYANEFNRQMLTGYLNPRDQIDRPTTPWAMWIILATAYGGVLAWIFLTKATKPDAIFPGGEG